MEGMPEGACRNFHDTARFLKIVAFKCNNKYNIPTIQCHLYPGLQESRQFLPGISSDSLDAEPGNTGSRKYR